MGSGVRVGCVIFFCCKCKQDHSLCHLRRMNLTGENLLRFWAALRSDLEGLQGKFLDGNSFEYQAFCKNVRESKFLLILKT